MTTRLFASMIAVSVIFSPAMADPPKPVLFVSSGIAEGRKCGFKVNESIAAAYIRRSVGKASFSAEELTGAMVSVIYAETVSAYVGLTTPTDSARVCANVLGQFGVNGTVVPGLLSK